MFLEFFDWFCNSLTSVFEIMKKFVLFEGFTYYHFCIALLAIPIIFKLLSFIMAIEDEESYFTEYTSDYMNQYDNNSWNKYNNRPIVRYSWYTPKHRASYRDEYIPKHQQKGRHGK